MPASPHFKCAQRPAQGGFALVIALSLMAFVLLLLLSITTLVQVETQGSQIQMQQMEAEQSALLGLQIALGELQKTAGPDQRVTATADLFNDPNDISKAPVQGRNRWAGVWDTSNYSPKTPDIKTFKRWLVSSNEDNGLVSDSDALEGNLSNPYTIFKGVNATGAPEAANDVIVDKISFSSAGSLGESAYAYWVEDEGVKADLAWNEGTYADDELELKQSARLSAAPGIDYEVFASDDSSPFKNKVAHPIELDGSDNSWLVNMSKATSPAGMPLVTVSKTDATDWLKSVRHDVTFGSRAVLADVKNGGLRRDLSLAFEMDGDEDVSVTEKPTLFNKQFGEFVGRGNVGQDPLSAPRRPNGLPTFERLLWRDYPGAGNTFSNDIKGTNPVMRGPNWWALRDYANLYKRLSGTEGDYTMQARAYYPNRSSEGLAYSDYHSHFGTGQTWDREIGINSSGNNKNFYSTINTSVDKNKEHYLYRPAAANYAPVNLGISFLVGLQARNPAGLGPDEEATAELAVSIDPLFYFWNPYNRKIRCNKIAVTFGTGIPGRVVFDYVNTFGEKQSKDLTLYTLLKNNLTNKTGNRIIFLIDGPFTLEPGEVVIATSKSSPLGGTGNGEAELGYQYSANSGIIMTKLNDNNPITVPLDSNVSFSFLQSKNKQGSSGIEVRHEMDTNLPADGVSLNSIVTDMKNLGEQTQHSLQVLWSGSTGPSIYVSQKGKPTEENIKDKVRTEVVENLIAIDPDDNSWLPVKQIFGGHALLIKPASPGSSNANPFEMFARFNPSPMLMKRDTYVQSFPNQIYRHATANSEFAVRKELGIDFSAIGANAFWGLSFQNNASKSVPMSNIPSSPIFSLADFAHANLSINATDPFHAVGNSWSNVMVSPSSTYGPVFPKTWVQTAQDFSWLINDALFDRYYLSGIAPEFSIGSGGYNATGTLAGTLDKFYGEDSSKAKANPALEPYIPEGETASVIVSELTPSNDDAEGYKKLGAYSLIKGAFNVNSTSVPAWAALLRSNRGLVVDYILGGSSSDNNTTPFPSSNSPTAPLGKATAEWSGLSRLSDSEISILAQEIVNQVRRRGPFMSISDFVNHRVGPLDTATSYTGALQAAIDEASKKSDINSGSRNAAANSDAVDANARSGTLAYGSNLVKKYVPFGGPDKDRKSTTGIPGDITQADILRPIAPRLNARSDTFRIRAYGEVKDAFGNVSSAICEAVVQRVPEYLVQGTSAGANNPWDDGDTLTSDRPLGDINQQFGRRFRIHSLRWLNSNDV